MWVFTRVRDSTRLRKGRLSANELDWRVNQLLRGTQGALWLMDGLQFLRERSDDARAQILGEMPVCDAYGHFAASPNQPDPIDSEGPRRRRQLVLPFDIEDEAQDWVFLVERIRQAP
jgi:hypothetical protein